jgi:hypothetical protein
MGAVHAKVLGTHCFLFVKLVLLEADGSSAWVEWLWKNISGQSAFQQRLRYEDAGIVLTQTSGSLCTNPISVTSVSEATAGYTLKDVKLGDVAFSIWDVPGKVNLICSLFFSRPEFLTNAYRKPFERFGGITMQAQRR